MQHIKRRGLARYVGVCNHDATLLAELASSPPDVLQAVLACRPASARPPHGLRLTSA